MSLEVMETLASVEERLKKRKADAAAAAKQAAVDAREKGEQMVADAVRKAEQEIGELTRQTDEKAKAAAETLAGDSETDRATLRAQAQTREEEAVSLVVERIVTR